MVKKSGKAALALICGLAATLAADRVLAERDAKISGVGLRKCSDWNTWKAERNGEARAISVEWAQGFVSGHNVYYRGDSSQSLVNPNAKTVAALLDSYCQKYPDERLISGVADMVKSLGGASVDLSAKRPARSGGQASPEL